MKYIDFINKFVPELKRKNNLVKDNKNLSKLIKNFNDENTELSNSEKNKIISLLLKSANYPELTDYMNNYFPKEKINFSYSSLASLYKDKAKNFYLLDTTEKESKIKELNYFILENAPIPKYKKFVYKNFSENFNSEYGLRKIDEDSFEQKLKGFFLLEGEAKENKLKEISEFIINNSELTWAWFANKYVPNSHEEPTKNGLKIIGKELKKLQDINSEEDYNKQIKKIISVFNNNKTAFKRNFEPFAICNIIGNSRNFTEWDLYKINSQIQSTIFSFSKSEFDENIEAPFNKKNINKYGKESGNYLCTKSFHEEFSKKYNLNIPDGYVSNINEIFKHAKNTYLGVIKKVENKNLNSNKEPESAFDENNCLKNKPGINNVIYGLQQNKLKHLSDKDILSKINYKEYTRKFNDSLTPKKYYNNLKIEKGNPGYIADKEKVVLYKTDTKLFRNARRKLNQQDLSNKNLPILYTASFGDDWVVFDGRGMLRQLYRWLAKNRLEKPTDLTIESLLRFFSGDFTIDANRNIVKICFSQGKIQQETLKPWNLETGRKFLTNQEFALVSMDLGQTNIFGAQISKVSSDENNFAYKKINNITISQADKEKLIETRSKLDELNQKLELEAINSLSSNDIEAIKKYNSESISVKTKKSLKEIFGIPENLFENMNTRTTYIADFLIANGKEAEAYCANICSDKLKCKSCSSKEKRNKNCKEEAKRKWNDKDFAKKYSSKLDKEINDRKQMKLFELQKKCKEYSKIALFKKEYIRYILMKIANQAKTLAQTEKIVFAIEDLTMSSFFDGKGKIQENSFEGFFLHKKENRWFIKNFNKELSSIPANHGIPVVCVDPKYTSQTCPKCFHCDKNNRNGEHFKCLNCNFYGNTDIDVAPAMITHVFVTGEPLSDLKKSNKNNLDQNNIGAASGGATSETAGPLAMS